MAGYGLQFQPGVPQNGANGNGQARGRVQEPVQILSTRLPKIFGAGAIAPPSLLPGGGGGGMGNPAARGNVVAQALAQLAGLPPGMMPSGAAGHIVSPWEGPPSPQVPIMPGGPMLPPPPDSGRMGPGFPGGGPIFQPPPYNPPPPVFTPGNQPGQPPPVISRPEPAPAPPRQLIEPPSPGGYGDWAGHERELNGRMPFDIQDFARSLFR